MRMQRKGSQEQREVGWMDANALVLKSSVMMPQREEINRKSRALQGHLKP